MTGVSPFIVGERVETKESSALIGSRGGLNVGCCKGWLNGGDQSAGSFSGFHALCGDLNPDAQHHLTNNSHPLITVQARKCVGFLVNQWERYSMSFRTWKTWMSPFIFKADDYGLEPAVGQKLLIRTTLNGRSGSALRRLLLISNNCRSCRWLASRSGRRPCLRVQLASHWRTTAPSHRVNARC